MIAFNVNYGPADMIRDGETGFLVPFGDEALLAARLVGLFRDPARHERMCAAALESSGDFAPDTVAVKWRGLIDALQNTRNTAGRRRAR